MSNVEEASVVQIFAKNLFNYRKQRGFSQYDLANLTGISRRMICQYENKGTIPPGDRLQALADALEIPVSKLFENNTGVIDHTGGITDIDPRSVKKLRDILSLPVEDRNDLYRILNKMLRKNQLEKQKSVPLP
ncbi:MAG: helix-turn-helix domain-containing protein [Treponema sp.]|jgi:transcriptional regulator with XRE-family HTH domain|nr:helix-turn-helix domain-containing protein [Treponema sp.]